MALAELHHLIEKEDRARAEVRFSFQRTEREVKMPLLFYLPLIIWRGPLEVEQGETRVALKVKA